MARITFFRTIRGVEVEVFADAFDGDPSVGVAYGPEELWAKSLDGEDFELTEEEAEDLGIAAARIYTEDD